MKPLEIRGLPLDEIKGMLTDAEGNLFDARFQNAVGHLENKRQMTDLRKEIALLKTILREETMKADMEKAKSILTELSQKLNLPDLKTAVNGERINLDQARLRRTLRKLVSHPQKKEFHAEFQELKKIANI
ncbi:MAG: 50S ribosomal protein L29 [Bacteroidetes bacterium]|nr:50S ribosomal protein L29 [Bacteroidota bacterium]